MLLAIDVGNTNTVLGLFDGESLTRHWRISTDSRRTADELALLLRGLLDGAPTPTAIAVCSTVPAVLHQVREMTEVWYGDIPAVIVEPGIKTGVPILYDNPKEVGADRIVNALAAFTVYGGPAIVVDFGTTTNFDVVSVTGEFVGGVLAPGIEISVDALAARAAQLRKVELVKPRQVIGKNTVESLQSGIIHGFAGQVDRIVELIIGELGGSPTVVATGGLAPLIVGESRCITVHDPWLTLTGLRLIFDRNKD
ncbi:MAG: pantothenate kinase [Frankiales bacterium]|nr:pantothenate kinase [Frankiales bacterium]